MTIAQVIQVCLNNDYVVLRRKMKNPIILERELKRAHAITEVSNVIVNTAKAETDYMRVTGKTPDSQFIPLDATTKKQLKLKAN